MVWPMITLRGHFDGKALQLDEPADLPLHGTFEIQLKPLAPAVPRKMPLAKLVRELADLPENPDWPREGASQHDHSLHGTPKRP